MQLKEYGTLQDILNSNASAEFKAACFEMARDCQLNDLPNRAVDVVEDFSF